ncbi:adenylylsulfatase HINT3-like [Pistacia vera]|uniref:adenylylsulfatase HINT3-like n=1 Tax=Pistacia vera TaxID=55513 RepID=UPI001263505A|nr:adenylylsulfatase HINT3-like [Pistacia vera]
MAATRRRLDVLCSHLRTTDSPPTPTLFTGVSLSFCASGEQRLSDSNVVTQNNDCVFCKIIRGESPAFKLFEDDMCLCILDTNPLSRGHSLIIPKSHFPSLEATPPSVIAAMCSKVPIISNAIMKTTASDSFNLLVNNGVAAGQVIFHTHIHIIPRKARDCLWASESLRRHPLKLDQETSRLADQVRKQLSNISEDTKGIESSLS